MRLRGAHGIAEVVGVIVMQVAQVEPGMRILVNEQRRPGVDEKQALVLT